MERGGEGVEGEEEEAACLKRGSIYLMFIGDCKNISLFMLAFLVSSARVWVLMLCVATYGCRPMNITSIYYVP